MNLYDNILTLFDKNTSVLGLYDDILKFHTILNIKNTNKIENNILTVDYGPFTINYINDKIIKIESSDLIGLHVVRLIKLKYEMKVDLLFDIIEYMQNLIDNYSKIFNQCTICSKNIYADKPSICLDEVCVRKSYNIIFDNTVTECYNKDKFVFIFLIQTAVAGLFHPKRTIIYKPLPIIQNTTTLEHIDTIIPENFKNNNLTEFLTLLSSFSTEIQVHNFLKEQMYAFVKNIILSNKTNLITNKEKSNEGMIHFDILYDPQVEHKFGEMQYCLFHGSNICNWYSIMRNGIKNMSGTELMANGQVHGAGVYLSNNYNMSYGYSSGNQKFNYNVTGVVQVIDAKNTVADKGGSIFVANDDTKLLLRSLIVNYGVIARKSNEKSIDINSYYTKDKISEHLHNLEVFGHLSGIRLKNEMKIILKNESDKIILVSSDKAIENLIAWKFFLVNFDNPGLNKIELNILFPHKYPLDGPFIYLSTYLKEADNYLITSEGLIILEQTSPKKWSTFNKIQQILEIVWNKINEIYVKGNMELIENKNNVLKLRERYSEIIKTRNLI